MSEPIDTDTVLNALGLSAEQEDWLIALLVETRRQAREEGRQEERARCAAVARDRGLRSHKDFRWMAEEIEREIEAGTAAERSEAG